MFSISVSQVGQDFWVYGEAYNEKENGYFVDIGAYNGVFLSNTYLLEVQYNWNGLCIEADPQSFQELKENRDVTCLNICIDQAEGEVDFVQRKVLSGIIGEGLDNRNSEEIDGKILRLKTIPLIKVLKENNAPSVIDYLSIDVEGAEERILSEFDFNAYTFRCITIERPSKNLRDLLESHHYHLIKEIPKLDCFYVHRDFLKQYKHNLFQFYRKKYVKFSLFRKKS